MNIWQANPKILDTLRVAGALLSSGEMTHSYMHCWRHKTPLIYRATAQWFVRMDAPDEDTKSVLGLPAAEKTLRQAALEGVKATKFFPEWGINRLYSMIENRPAGASLASATGVCRCPSSFTRKRDICTPIRLKS